MNTVEILVTRRQYSILKDLCPSIMFHMPLSRMSAESVLNRTEAQFSRDLDWTSCDIFYEIFRAFVIPVDGIDGSNYIEPEDDERIFNVNLKEE